MWKLIMAFVYTMTLFISISLTACEREGPAERAGEKIDEMGERAGDALEDAGDRVD